MRWIVALESPEVAEAAAALLADLDATTSGRMLVVVAPDEDARAVEDRLPAGPWRMDGGEQETTVDEVVVEWFKKRAPASR